jgi:hypothetical protein
MKTLLISLVLTLGASGARSAEPPMSDEAMEEAAGMPQHHRHSADDAAMTATTPIGVPGVDASHDAGSSAAPEGRAVAWRSGRRAPIYVGLMLLGEGLVEDASERLTGRRTRTLEGVGGLLRAGAVLDEHSRIGVRMQSFWRPTKTVLNDDGSRASPQSWGSVQLGYIGPEYLYTTSSGVYVAGSVGFTGVMSVRDRDCNDWGSCDSHHDHGGDVQRGAVGGGALASLGYEWRAGKWLALSTEIFAGVYGGLDENERAMRGSVFGAGVGLGF